jgi:hypothetical protein
VNGIIEVLEYKDAIEFLLPKHYSGRSPSISIAFGWYIKGELVAVCSFGKPASASLCKGIMGEKYSQNVYELNRLCRVDWLDQQLSTFVAACLRRLRGKDWIIVSYSDTEMGHHGYIYQACNFIYTGKTRERTDKFTEGNKHSRHYKNTPQNGLRMVRSSKHRYVYFASINKQLKKDWLNGMTYPVLPYPKGTNSNYKLGEYLQPNVIEDKRLVDEPSS